MGQRASSAHRVALVVAITAVLLAAAVGAVALALWTGSSGTAPTADASQFDRAPAQREERATDVSRGPQQAPVTTLASLTITSAGALSQLVAEGLATGTGIPADPYVISRIHVTGDVHIKDADVAIELSDLVVDGRLKLNYVGDDVHVHHNRIADLRVNENLHRSGPTTAGLIELNDIGLVGQLRHWSGTFSNNLVGPAHANTDRSYVGDDGMEHLEADLLVNLDGFHEGRFVDNDVLGPVRIKLHGHYHGNCFECPAHQHGLAVVGHGDHQLRYHAVEVTGNRIEVHEGQKPFAIHLHDYAHKGDDHEAASEKEASLALPHDHFVRAIFDGNELVGAPFKISRLVAPDPLHLGRTSETRVELADNSVTLDVPPPGADAPWAVFAYDVFDTRNLTLIAKGNAYAFPGHVPTPEGMPADGPKAIGLRFAKTQGSVTVSDTRGSPSDVGLFIANSAELDLLALDNQFGAVKSEGFWNG